MRLLVPLDQRCSERVVFPFCQSIGAGRDVMVTITHVIPPYEPLIPGTVREAEAYLAIAARELADSGVPVEQFVRHGDPAIEILALAEELNASMIVMAARSEANMDGHRLGRVTSDVLAASDRPVVLIKP